MTMGCPTHMANPGERAREGSMMIFGRDNHRGAFVGSENLGQPRVKPLREWRARR
jgi:hypothetical protein